MDNNQNNGNARQRIVRTEGQILTILDEYEKSAFTAKEFCEISDINDATLYYWLKKYRSKPEDDEVKGLAKVEVTPMITNARPLLFARFGDIEKLQTKIIKAVQQIGELEEAKRLYHTTLDIDSIRAKGLLTLIFKDVGNHPALQKLSLQNKFDLLIGMKTLIQCFEESSSIISRSMPTWTE